MSLHQLLRNLVLLLVIRPSLSMNRVLIKLLLLLFNTNLNESINSFDLKR